MGDLCIAAEQENIEVAGHPVTLANLKEKASHVANHVLEKAAATDTKNERRVIAPETAVENPADFGAASLAAVVGAGKGGEIVFAEKAGGSIGHSRLIEGVWMVVQITAQEGRANLFAPDAIFVSFCDCIKTGVEAGVALAHFGDANVLGQQVVESYAEVGLWNRAIERKGGTDGKRVDACVCAATAHNVNGLAFELPQRFLDLTLDGGEAGLDLPAMVGSAVVADEDAQRAHVSGGTGAGLDDGQALGAHRTNGGFVGRNFKSCERDARHPHVGAATAAVDDRSGREHLGPGGQE